MSSDDTWAHRQRSAGITEVARRAKVSTATVSRVVNKPEVVAPATRDHVWKVMEELDFHINRAASGLRRGDSKTIAIVVAGLAQPWYAKLIGAIRADLSEHDYSTLIYDLEHEADRLLEFLDAAPSYGSSGIILSTGDYLERHDIRTALTKVRGRTPLVVIGQPVKGATWPTIQYNDRASARAATEHLIDQNGGGPIAFLGEPENSFLGIERRLGYVDACEAAGVTTDEWIWQIDDVHHAAGYREMRRNLDQGLTPRGVLAVNDEIALGAHRAIVEEGLRVPDDVGVVGFGDTPFAGYVVPALSSVAGPAERIAALACDALRTMFDGVDLRDISIVDRELIVRESSGSNRTGRGFGRWPTNTMNRSQA